MLLVDVYFVWLIIPLALIFTIMAFHYIGLVWMPFIPAVLWALTGMFLIQRPEVFTYQGYISLLFFGLAIAVLFAPHYLGAKHLDVDEQEEMTPREENAARRKKWQAKINEIKKMGRYNPDDTS